MFVESVRMYGVACFAHHLGNYKIMPSGWPVVITEEVAYNLWLICNVCVSVIVLKQRSIADMLQTSRFESITSHLTFQSMT